MGIFSRLKTGFKLSIDSLRVLRAHPKLLIYPAISGIASIIFMIALLGPLFLTSIVGVAGLEYVALFVVYLGTAFIAAFFNAALVHSAREVFRGNTPTIGGGLSAAANHLGPLLIWAFVSAVVGVIIQSLQSQNNVVGQIVGTLFSFGWAVATFFIIPVIVFEDVSATEMFTKSARTFVDTWGETVGARLGLWLVPGIIVLTGVLAAAAIIFVLPTAATFITGALIVLVAVVTAILVSGVITAVTKTALYVYATEGRKPEEFSNFDFETLDGAPEKKAGSASTLTGNRGNI